MADADSISREIVSHKEAKERGLLKFFTNRPCPHGHISERFVSSRGCVQCAALRGKSDARKQYRQEYMRAKAEQLRLSKQRDYLDNREKRKATQLAYREKNRQRIRDAGRAYRAANPEKAKAISLNAHHKRRAAKADGMTGAEFFAWRKAAPKVCYWCGKDCKKDFAVDHYVPLSRGGKHQKDNLVIACPPCNATKRAKDPLEFAQSIGRLF